MLNSTSELQLPPPRLVVLLYTRGQAVIMLTVPCKLTLAFVLKETKKSLYAAAYKAESSIQLQVTHIVLHTHASTSSWKKCTAAEKCKFYKL